MNKSLVKEYTMPATLPASFEPHSFVAVIFDKDGNFHVTGPLHNPALCLDMLANGVKTLATMLASAQRQAQGERSSGLIVPPGSANA